MRVPPDLAAWVRDTAAREHTPPGTLLRRLVDQARTGERWPPDVQRWLTAQAACCGTPGDPEGALIAVVRHLAARWPNGARLIDD